MPEIAPPPRKVVTDRQITEALDHIFRSTNAITAVRFVVPQLESKFGADLSDRTEFIRRQIEDVLAALSRPPKPKPFHHRLQDSDSVFSAPNFKGLPLNFSAREFSERYNSCEFQRIRSGRPPLSPKAEADIPCCGAAKVRISYGPIQLSKSRALPPPPPTYPKLAVDTPGCGSSEERINYGPSQPPHLRAPPPPPPPSPTELVDTPLATDDGTKQRSSTLGKRRCIPALDTLHAVSTELLTSVDNQTLPNNELTNQLVALNMENNGQDPKNITMIDTSDNEVALNMDSNGQDPKNITMTDRSDNARHLESETDSIDMLNKNEFLGKATQDPKRQKVDMEVDCKKDDTNPVVIISEALASFFGADEREMSQEEVSRKMWEYIKDPLNSITISCDAKLKELLGCESLSAMQLQDTLAQRHFSKKPTFEVDV